MPQVKSSAWETLTTGAWCYYQNTSANQTTYGKLYNWYAVNDPRGLAPQGWHIPAVDEWFTLTNTCLGGYTQAGGKMKEDGNTHWPLLNTGATSSSGFTGLPGGARTSLGTDIKAGFNGSWWSSSENNIGSSVYCRLVYNSANVYITTMSKPVGCSVRCVKD